MGRLLPVRNQTQDPEKLTFGRINDRSAVADVVDVLDFGLCRRKRSHVHTLEWPELGRIQTVGS